MFESMVQQAENIGLLKNIRLTYKEGLEMPSDQFVSLTVEYWHEQLRLLQFWESELRADIEAHGIAETVRFHLEDTLKQQEDIKELIGDAEKLLETLEIRMLQSKEFQMPQSNQNSK